MGIGAQGTGTKNADILVTIIAVSDEWSFITCLRVLGLLPASMELWQVNLEEGKISHLLVFWPEILV